jgi:F420-non-reducing hydrogenase iron-sulfur subunit
MIGNAVCAMPPLNKTGFRPKVTVFYCFNAIRDDSFTLGANADIKTVKMPCSSMIREVFLLRAFESGADAVVVLACPEGQCHFVEGNIRAARRVARTKRLVEEIGLDGRRLNLFNVPQGDKAAAEQIINATVAELADIGPNPAA